MLQSFLLEIVKKITYLISSNRILQIDKNYPLDIKSQTIIIGVRMCSGLNWEPSIFTTKLVFLDIVLPTDYVMVTNSLRSLSNHWFKLRFNLVLR